MQIIETKGNQELMNRDKTLFLCSKRTPVDLYEYIFRWTDSLSERDCIACFNSTEMESEVLKALLVAKIPTILFVMNRFTDVNNIQIEQALKENRILIVVLKCDEPKGRGQTPRLRNEYVLALCQHVVCGYINKNGSVFPLLAGLTCVEHLIDEKALLSAAEPETKRERWTVAQDKMLLRMYYADMGIHAIHKQLHRTYSAIYTRIRSITHPEEFLKGREFEDFVLELFNLHNDNAFILKEWQGDKTLGAICPESNRPLSEVPSVLSHAKSIVEFLRPSVESTFQITDFIPADSHKQQKAYTMEEKRADPQMPIAHGRKKMMPSSATVRLRQEHHRTL